jgi:hypothetical protein
MSSDQVDGRRWMRLPVQPAFTRAALLVLSLVTLLAGCARLGGSAEAAAPGYYEDSYIAESGDAMEMEPAPAPQRARSTGGALSAPSLDSVTIADQPSDDSTPAEEPAERLRVFTGDLGLSVPRVDETRQAIIDLANGIGGYVERSDADLVIIRVPAAQFFEAFDALEEMGEVINRSIQTADVTDQYTDLERRLEISRRSRDRLYELLERAEDADERVAILREIRRLTEEVERLESALESLAELVQYSRITIRLVSRIQADQVMRDRIPFAWIARLEPLARTTGPADRPLDLTVPDGFAAFSDREQISAEAADGTRLRVGGRENLPAGDAEFWADALAFHLAPFYSSVSRQSAGAFRGVLFESKDRDPYYYLVAVANRGDELLVAEAFFPDAAALDRHADSVKAMLANEEEDS